jgi:hypothetical protein
MLGRIDERHRSTLAARAMRTQLFLAARSWTIHAAWIRFWRTNMTTATLTPAADAKQVIAQLGLERFVKRWNIAVENASLIADWEQLNGAIDLDKRLSARLDRVYEQVRRVGDVPAFEAAMRDAIRPMIVETLITGIELRVSWWARELASGSPTKSDAPAPFKTAADWIEWCVTTGDGPILCGPYGENLLSREATEHRMRNALSAVQDVAVANGWIASEARGSSSAS